MRWLLVVGLAVLLAMITAVLAHRLPKSSSAATAAADDGVEFYVNSGWRSPEYQDQLLREAVSKYGSEDEAARWVSAHGAAYGLCRSYRNEPWHNELRTDAIDSRCPRMYADPTEGPRTQQ